MQKWNFRLVFSAELDKCYSFQRVVALAAGRFTWVEASWFIFINGDSLEFSPVVVLMPNLFADCNALTPRQKMIPAWKSRNSISYSLQQGRIRHIVCTSLRVTGTAMIEIEVAVTAEEFCRKTRQWFHFSFWQGPAGFTEMWETFILHVLKFSPSAHCWQSRERDTCRGFRCGWG